MSTASQAVSSAAEARPQAPVKGGLAGWQVRRLVQLGEGDLRALTVSQLAREVRLSPKHFSRAFTASLGLSPSRWLTRTRVERAATLLSDTDLPVSDIARQVGYRSAAQLTRAFKAHHGATPSAYREGGERNSSRDRKATKVV